jgi:hypothetical protein
VSLRLVIEMLGLPPLGSIDEVAFVLHLIQTLLVSIRSNPSANRFYEISNGDHHVSGSHQTTSGPDPLVHRGILSRHL